MVKPHEMSPSSSSSAGPVDNATDVLQAGWLFKLTLFIPLVLDVPTFAARYLHVHNDARDPRTKGGTVWA